MQPGVLTAAVDARRWRDCALRLCCALLLLEALATAALVAAVTVGGAAPWQSFGALACLCCFHALRGALLAGQLVGFDMQPLLKVTLPPTSLGLILISAFVLPGTFSFPAAELLFPLAMASAVGTLGCVGLLTYETASAEADLEAPAKSEARRSHLARLQLLTINIVGADGLEGLGEQTCLICLGEFQRGDMLLQLKCKHLHHAQCIQRWFLSGGGCPLRCIAEGSVVVAEDEHFFSI